MSITYKERGVCMKKHVSKQEIIAIHQKRIEETVQHVADLLYEPLIDALQKYAEENQNIGELRCEIPIGSLIVKDYVMPPGIFNWLALCGTRTDHEALIVCIEERIHARFPDWESVYVIAGNEEQQLSKRTLRFTDACGITIACPRPETFTSMYVKELDRMFVYFTQSIYTAIKNELGKSSGATIIIRRLQFQSIIILDNKDADEMYVKIQQNLRGCGWHVAEVIDVDGAVINGLNDRRRQRICTSRTYEFTLEPLK